jgi:hypothetical protein
MIEQGAYYLISTRLGDRVTEAHSQDHISGLFYGSISPSNYETKGDNVSIGFSEAIRVATEAEQLAWETWYAPEETNEE